MAPKKKDVKSDRGQQKALEKQKQKVVEDKTFGLKNKNKSKTVQKYIKAVQQQVKGPLKGGDQTQARQAAEKDEKKKTAQQAALLASLFKGTENVKKIMGDESNIGSYDPKTSKEDQRIDLYIDQREQKELLEDLDEETFEEMIRSRLEKQAANQTGIICKHFVEAVERKQYGWFWVCPNGGDACKYRHCLPLGYVLKRDLTAEEMEDYEETPIEEIIERERMALPAGGTPVTLESFVAWKKKKEEDRLKQIEETRQAEAKKTGGRGLHVLTGKDLFIYDPSLFVDDEGAASEDDYDEDEEYWNETINANQRALEEANNQAQNKEDPGTDEESDSCKREQNGFDVAPGKEALFLDDDIPDHLDALEDD